MNEHAHSKFPLSPDGVSGRFGTRAADGFERIVWTTNDMQALADAGIFNANTRIELIEGELLPMPPKGSPHEIFKNDFIAVLVRAVAPEMRVAVESSLRLNDVNWYDPDIIVYPKSILPEDVRGPDVLLVVEVADSSVPRDTRLKAPVYARCGVTDYWVVDTTRRVIIIHRGPKLDGAWTDIHEAGAHEVVNPLAFPDIAVTLAELLPE